MGDRIPKLTIQFLLELGEIIARTLLNLKMNLRTRHLLEESRTMTEELQSNEEQLQENAREMKSSQSKLETANIQLEGKIEVRKALPLSLSFDHRVVDGAEAARFMNTIVDHLEDPDLILLEA